MSDLAVRDALPEDASEVRSLVTRALFAAGLPAPEPGLDDDLVDLGYYRAEGRAIWVAERDGVVVGCAAIDRGEPGAAVLRRLAGGGLEALVEAAVEFAAARSLGVIETVLPPGLPGTQEALRGAGFESPPGANTMLLRKRL